IAKGTVEGTDRGAAGAGDHDGGIAHGTFPQIFLPNAGRLAKRATQVKRLDAVPQKRHLKRNRKILHLRRRNAQRHCQRRAFADTLKNAIKTG
ncbi:hypothetical protein, partial [Ensifer adhaerens]|uniref:hypothetical protein n=1 Tax=Ensifer adhaerens TaxID=106592 RepID=UPI003F83A9E3